MESRGRWGGGWIRIAKGVRWRERRELEGEFVGRGLDGMDGRGRREGIRDRGKGEAVFLDSRHDCRFWFVLLFFFLDSMTISKSGHDSDAIRKVTNTRGIQDTEISTQCIRA